MEVVYCVNVTLKINFRPIKLQQLMQMIHLFTSIKANAISL